jgi:predicted outer membrane repeat protein
MEKSIKHSFAGKSLSFMCVLKLLLLLVSATAEKWNTRVLSGKRVNRIVQTSTSRCVSSETQLRNAIESASSYDEAATIITLCNDIDLYGPLLTYTLSNRNIDLRCNKAAPARCTLEAKDRDFRIFQGTRTKLSATRVDFKNAGKIESGIFILGGALFFNSSRVVLRECSFYGNRAHRGGAIYVEGADSVLILKGGTKTSPMLFSGNAANYGGAISVRGAKLFSIRQSNTIFMDNSAYAASKEDSTSGGAIRLLGVTNADITNTSFQSNNVETYNFVGTVRTDLC